MKQKYKLILDAVLVILLILLMFYSFTGGMLHEILGLVILAGFLGHVIWNRKYYGAAVRALKKKSIPVKMRLSFAVNILLPVASVVMLVSSLAISHDLFPAVSDAFGSYGAWVMVHVISAVLLAMSVFVHVCLHGRLFLGMIRNATKNPAVVKAWRAGSRVLAFVLAVLLIKASIESVADATIALAGTSAGNRTTVVTAADTAEDPSDPVQDSVVITQHPESTTAQEIAEPDEEEAPEVLSLEEYLSAIKCTGCSKHCLLIAPQCNKGVRQAEQAETEYYEIYGS